LPGARATTGLVRTLDFHGGKLLDNAFGGLNFVDARDAASAFCSRLPDRGRHGERYLLGAVN